MPARRTYMPVAPVRWIHARRGEARTKQHVVAYRTDEATPPKDRTHALCGVSVGDGRLPSGSAARRMWRLTDEQRRRARAQWSHGPKTQRPLVTLTPRPDLPKCDACVTALSRVGVAAG